MARKVSGQETPRVALSQIEDLMKGSAQRADALRAGGLQTLVSIKRAKLVQTTRERARLAIRYGDDSPQVERLDRQMSVEQRFLASTRAEADRASVPPIERDENSWKVHGFVRGKDGIGRSGVTVTLVSDEQGNQTAGKTVTDKRGYFQLELGKGTGRLREAARAFKEAEDNSKGDMPASERHIMFLVSALEHNFYLATRSSGSREQVVDPRPLNPMPGGVAYHDITLSDEADDDGTSFGLRTQFLGNSSTREVHDLAREQPGCNISQIRADHRYYLHSIVHARKLGYDFCAKCFGPEMSER